MNKTRKASVLYIVIPICLAIVIFIIWYGYPFKKFTDQNLKVYQLALTAFAATVGIGTVVNSSRSADIAVKSMELATKKESREQSCHLILSSSLTQFDLSPPMYENDFSYSPLKIIHETFKKVESAYDEETTKYKINEESAKKTVKSLSSKKIKRKISSNHMRILNIGKGAGVNLEISFEFLNLKDFANYQATSDEVNSTYFGEGSYPYYDLSIINSGSIYVINVADNFVRNYQQLFNSENHEKILFPEIDLEFKDERKTKYIDFVNPHNEIEFAIPNEYMILCKHYALVYRYKKLYEENKIPFTVLPNVQHLISSNIIKPLGRLSIKYYDEEMVREKYYKNLHKKEVQFDLSIKNESIISEDQKINFYIEIIPVPLIETPSKTKKRSTVK
ncbi:hypothetical protein [Exiguobacterium sp. s78]|uniref:hypothetical protein n=1 Tax=Exiguobacterium sp. s78 TaxID=2751197 RepID=UPI001BE4FC64|nr:hypothetical protein [Exiguobacterium sp. s78]